MTQSGLGSRRPRPCLWLDGPLFLTALGFLCFLCLVQSIPIVSGSTTHSIDPAAPAILTVNETDGVPIFCMLYNSTTVELVCNGTKYVEEEEKDSPGSGVFFVHGTIVIFLVIVAGLMSGLTIGLVGLDLTTLEILARSGSETERRNAAKLLPIVHKHHILLVTLLLSNAAAMEALPIFLEKMVPNWAAVLISVTLVLFFGEIIPQAICARWGLAVGASVHWLVWGLIWILYPISYPISKVLDAILGHKQTTLFRRAQLKEFVNIHSGHKLQNDLIESDDEGMPPEERLTYDEVMIIKGALDLKSKTAKDVITPLEKVYMLDIDSDLDMKALQAIHTAGRSRVPIYHGDRTSIVGMLLVKSLIAVDFSHPRPIRSLEIRKIPQVAATTPLYNMLNVFQTGRSHLAVVIDNQRAAMGIITLEDVFEELIGEDIEDETDYLQKNRSLENLVGANIVSLDTLSPLMMSTASIPTSPGGEQFPIPHSASVGSLSTTTVDNTLGSSKSSQSASAPTSPHNHFIGVHPHSPIPLEDDGFLGASKCPNMETDHQEQSVKY